MPIHGLLQSSTLVNVEDTWASRELPILEASLRRLDAGQGFAQLRDIADELTFADDEIRAGVRALCDAQPPYLSVQWAGGRAIGHVDAVFERARRELGSWPSADAMVTQLVAALTSAAEAETEPERKGRLRAAAEVIGGMARDIAVAVFAKRLGE